MMGKRCGLPSVRFLNQIDEIIIFHALQKQELRQIVQLQVARLVQRLAS